MSCDEARLLLMTLIEPRHFVMHGMMILGDDLKMIMIPNRKTKKNMKMILKIKTTIKIKTTTKMKMTPKIKRTKMMIFKDDLKEVDPIEGNPSNSKNDKGQDDLKISKFRCSGYKVSRGIITAYLLWPCQLFLAQQPPVR